MHACHLFYTTMPVSEQVVTSERYGLIPRSLIFLTHGEHVLLLKGAPHKHLWANRYNGIGGHIERGEDILKAAQRELQEETGLSVVNLWLCGIVTIDYQPQLGIVLFVFRGECPDCPVFPSAEGTPEWIPFHQITQIPLVEDLSVILPRVLAMQPGETPVFAQYSYNTDDHLTIRIHDPSV